MTLPQSAFRFCQDRPLLGLSAGDRGIALRNTLWTPGQVITIGFMDGTTQQRADFQTGLQIWAPYTNLNFQIVNNPASAMVRVTFALAGQSWSELGTNALTIPSSRATISIGWAGMDLILHEIGHMLGFGHEHQNPDNPIEWNVQVLNEVLTGPPNNWTTRMIELNVIERYTTNQIIGTSFDPQSIMLYPVDPTWTLNNYATAWNQMLSAKDKQLAQQVYPFPEGVTVKDQVVAPVEDGSILISNRTDDPDNPIFINENGATQTASLAGLGTLLGIGTTLWLGSKLIQNIFSNEN